MNVRIIIANEQPKNPTDQKLNALDPKYYIFVILFLDEGFYCLTAKLYLQCANSVRCVLFVWCLPHLFDGRRFLQLLLMVLRMLLRRRKWIE